MNLVVSGFPQEAAAIPTVYSQHFSADGVSLQYLCHLPGGGEIQRGGNTDRTGITRQLVGTK